jgi:type IV pilus assembly protein PilE
VRAPRTTPPRLRADAGFTLIEVSVVTAIVGLLAVAGWPGFSDYMTRARRADAVAALTKVQVAQEAFHAHHGLYAGQLSSLVGAAASASPQGLYTIALRSDGPTRYEALATARADGPMAADAACAVMNLRVQDGLPDFGPTPRCWNR